MTAVAWYFSLDGKTAAARRQSLTAAAPRYSERFNAALPAPLRITRSGKTIVLVYPIGSVAQATPAPVVAPAQTSIIIGLPLFEGLGE